MKWNNLIATLFLPLLASCSVPQNNNTQFEEFSAIETTADETEEVDASDIKVSKGAAAAIKDLQSDIDNPQEIKGTTRLRIVSYNCENLYDTYDDPKTNDDEFTPNGEKKWDKAKYKIKLINVAKAIRAAGNGKMPAVIGLVEIENKTVLNDLRNQDILKNENYRYVHKDSPDSRGIDVALFYKTDVMKLVSENWIPVNTSKYGKSRDILYAKMKLQNDELLHIFVNHWPSMREGSDESEPKRIAAAKALRQAVDNIYNADGENANIVIMGDFNSNLSQTAMADILKVKGQNAGKGNLTDMLSRYEGNDNIGTHKYGKNWDVLDHIIVNGSMNSKEGNVFTTPYSGHICHEQFLLSQSKNGYYSPKRSFKGDVWTSGYSDHLPVSLDLYVK